MQIISLNDDLRNAKGKLTCADDDEYDGEWKDDLPRKENDLNIRWRMERQQGLTMRKMSSDFCKGQR